MIVRKTNEKKEETETSRFLTQMISPIDEYFVNRGGGNDKMEIEETSISVYRSRWPAPAISAPSGGSCLSEQLPEFRDVMTIAGKKQRITRPWIQYTLG